MKWDEHWAFWKKAQDNLRKKDPAKYAKVYGIDTLTDLAIIKVEATGLAVQEAQALADVVLDEVHRGAAHGGEGELDVDHAGNGEAALAEAAVAGQRLTEVAGADDHEVDLVLVQRHGAVDDQFAPFGIEHAVLLQEHQETQAVAIEAIALRFHEHPHRPARALHAADAGERTTVGLRVKMPAEPDV